MNAAADKPMKTVPAQARILLVEDEPELAALIKDGLRSAGYLAVDAARVADALGLLESETFDGAVLDINLGKDLVFPVAERLAERGIPFLFASGNTGAIPAEYRTRPCIAKPYPLSQLIEALRSMMDDRPGRPPGFVA